MMTQAVRRPKRSKGEVGLATVYRGRACCSASSQTVPSRWCSQFNQHDCA